MHIRRFLFLLFVPFLFALGPPGLFATVGSITSTQCVPIDSTALSTVGIQVTGTWSGTLQPQVSIQGQAAVNTQVTPTGSSTGQSTITANGLFTASVAGTSTFFLCGNTVASGTAVVYLNGSTVPVKVQAGAAGATINPTNNVLPRRSSATAFADSALSDNGTTVTSTEQIALPALSCSPSTPQFVSNDAASGLMVCNASNGVQIEQSGTTNYQFNASDFFTNKPICDFAVGNGCLTFASGLISVTGAGNALLKSTNNSKFVTADFTSANSAALQAITGLSFPLGSTAVNFSFHCSLMYSQATNVAGDQFGIGIITTAPTNANATASAFTNATAVQGGSLNGLASTTPTAVVTFQPAVTTILGATMDGTIEAAGGGAATFNVYVLNGTAADVIVVKRGSYCTLS